MDTQPDTAAGPLPAYRAKLRAGGLAPDPSQAMAAERLQGLWVGLRGYDPPPRPANGNGFLSRLLRRKPFDEAPEGAPNGLYLVGEVGRGKSMLMDLFFAAAQVRRKRRIHFHRFMQDAHARIHEFKRANPDIDDPIPPLADSHRRRGGAAVFRRVSGQRHRRRDDPGPVVPGAVRARGDRRCHFKHAAGRSVQGQAGAGCVPAVH